MTNHTASNNASPARQREISGQRSPERSRSTSRSGWRLATSVIDLVRSPSLTLRASVMTMLLLAVTATAAHADDDKLPERKTFVPIEELDAVLSGDKEGVLLHRDEFEELFNAAQANAANAPRLPAPAIVSQAEYQASIQGDHLVIDASIQFRQFANGWQQLTFDVGNLSVEKATLNDDPARMTRRWRTGKGQSGFDLLVFHDTAGLATLKMRLSTQLSSVGNDKAARFQLPAAPSATLNVTVPAGQHLQLGSRLLERPADNDQPATYSVPAGGLNSSVLLLFSDQQDEEQADSLTFATTAYGVNVAPGEVTWQAKTSLQIFGTTIDRLFCTVPSRLEITDVESTGLESWELADDPNDAESTLITLNYRQPFDGSRAIVFRGVMATAAGEPWAVPELGIRNATSHIGRVVVQHPAAVRVRLVEANGARASAGTAGSLVYDVWKEDFSLAFETRTKQRDLQSNVSGVLNLLPNDVTFNGRVNITPYLAPAFAITFRLPADWVVDRMTVSGNDVGWQTSSREASWNEYTIPLDTPVPEGQQATFSFFSHQEIDGWPIEDNEVEIALPVIRLPGASVVVGSLAITGNLDIEPVVTDARGLDPAVVGVSGERLGFEFQSSDYEGTLTVNRRPSLISAQTIAFTSLDREVLRSSLEAILTISGGGLRELRIGLSESAGEDLQFRLLNSAARVIEQIPGDPNDNGIRIWNLKLDQRVVGDVHLAITASTPRGDTERFIAHQLTVPDADRINGYIAIEGGGDQQLQVTAQDANGEDLPNVDPVDVAAAARAYSPSQRIVAAYQYTLRDYSVALSETRFDRVAVPTAVCDSTRIRSVLGRTGELQQRAEFEFVAVGAQALRIQFPDDDTDLWAALLDGQPIEVRSTRTGYLVPLPASDDPTAQRVLRIFYRSQIEPLKQTGTIDLQPPLVTLLHSAGEEQRLEQLDQRWELVYPDGTVLTSSDGDFVPTSELYSYSVLGTLRSSFTRIDQDGLAKKSVVVITILVVVGVIGLVLRRQGVSVIGCLGASVAAGVLLMGFMAVSLQQSSYDAAVETAAVPQSAAPADGYYQDEFDAIPEYAEAEEEPMFGFSDNADDADGEIVELVDTAGKDDPTSSRAGENGGAIAGLAAPGTPATSPSPAMVPPSEEALPEPTAPAGGDAPEMDLSEIVQGDDDAPARTTATVDPFTAQPPGSLISEVEAITEVRGQMVQLQAQHQRELQQHRNRVDSAERRRERLDGLLSLELEDTKAPAGSTRRKFRYSGNRNAADGVGLRVHWQDAETGAYARIFLMVCVALFLWINLSASVQVRAVLAILGIGLPVSLISVAPLAIHPVLDGVFLGGVLSVTLWLLRAVYQFFQKPSALERVRRAASRSSVSSSASLILFALISGWATGAVEAAEQAPPAPAPQAKGVVVPYDPSAGPLDAERVLLSREQFLKLWNTAHPDQKITAANERTGIVADAFFDCRIKDGNDQAVSVQATFVLHSFQKHQIHLPVPLGPVALESATLDGKSAVLEVDTGKGNNRLLAVLDSPGLHTLDLKFDVPAQTSGSVGQFTLPVQGVPAGRAVFRLPETKLSVRVNGSSSAYRRVEDGEGELLQIPVDGNKPLTISWRPPEQLGMVAAIVHVDSGTSVRIDDTGVTEFARIDIRVPQGAIADLSFDVPDGLRIQRVDGPHLAGWGFNDVDGQRQLRAFFSPPVTDATQLNVQLFLDQQIEAATAVTVPTISPREVTRETGVIGVVAPDNLAVRGGDVSGLVQVNVTNSLRLPRVVKDADAPDTMKRNGSPPAYTPRLAWRYTTRPFQLNLNIERQRPESTAVVQHAATVGSRKVVVDSFVRATLKGSPRTALTFELGNEFLVLNVDATSLADWYVSEADAVNPRTLTVEFTRPLIGDVDVVLKGQTARNPDPFVSVEFPRPLELSSSNTSAGVWFDPAFDATAVDTEGWKSVAPEQVPGRLRSFNSAPLEFAYEATDSSAMSLGFTLQRAVPELTASSLVMVSVADTFIDYTFALKWTIEDAAVDQFSLTTPLWLEDRLNFNGAGIREVRSRKEGESLLWTIHLHNPVRGEYFAQAAVAQPPATDTVDTPPLQFLQPRFDEFGDAMDFELLEDQSHFALLVNTSQAQLVAEHGDSVEAVTVERIPLLLNQDLVDQAAELLQIRDVDAQPSWRVRRLQQTTGAPASVNVADLTLVLAEDGSWRCQAVYTVRNRRRQFLAVRLPDDSRLLSLFVRNQPSRPVTTQLGGSSVQLIPLPRTSDAQGSFKVTLVCAGAFEKGLPNSFVSPSAGLTLPTPRVVTTSESDEYGIPVARTLWTVHVPDSVSASLVDDPNQTNMTLTSDAAASDTAYGKSLVSDMANMVNVVKSRASSSAQKREAASNLKQLGLALENYRDTTIASEEGRQLQKQIADVQQEIQFNSDTIERYSENGVITGSGDELFDNNDESAQRSQITRNQFNLILGNSAVAVQSEDLNGNGVLDAGEDLNGNNVLDFVTNGQFDGPAGSDGAEGPSQMTANAPADVADNSFDVEIRTGKGLKGGGKEGEKDSERSPGKKTLSRSDRQEQSRANYGGLNDLFEGRNAQNDTLQQTPGGFTGSGSQSGGGFGGGGGGGMFNGNMPQGTLDFAESWQALGNNGAPGGQGRNSDQQPAQQEGAFWNQLQDVEQALVVPNDVTSQMLAGVTSTEATVARDEALRMRQIGNWSQEGGLSIRIAIPKSGTEMQFSKVGGQPMLTLQVRSQEVVSKGIGLIWTAVWIGLAIFLISVFRRVKTAGEVWGPAGWIMLLGGIICFLVLPVGPAALGLLAFLGGWLIIVTRYVRRGVA